MLVDLLVAYLVVLLAVLMVGSMAENLVVWMAEK
jgi:hypothetical protein